MYTVETYTNKYASNMDCITYENVTVHQIANDLLKTVKRWDYAIVSDENDDIVCNIYRDKNGFEIVWE